jgi:hypothetical protein
VVKSRSKAKAVLRLSWRIPRKLTQSTRLSCRRLAVRRAVTPARWSASLTQYPDQGEDLLLERPDGLQSQAMLDQGEALDQDVVRVDENLGAAQQVRPHRAGRGVGAIVGVQQGQHGGGVQEHAHCR